MWCRYLLAAISFLVVKPALCANGPIDFTKAPGGGPATLRECATYAFHPRSLAGSVYSLGCTTIACVCRPDLIAKAHDYIKTAVEANCGTDAAVDVEAAQKIYNDYCSANGFAIPGYTYVSTRTVRVPTEPVTPPPATATPGTDSFTAGPGGNSRNVPVDSPSTATVVRTVGVVTATVTVYRSSASPSVQPWAIFKPMLLLVLAPVNLMLVLADIIVVDYTAPPPPVAVSSVHTTFIVTKGPMVSTHIVTVAEGQPRTENSPGSSSRDVGVLGDSGSNENSGGGSGGSGGNGASGISAENGLSKLEIVGIVIGIVLGVITTIATVWMCVRGGGTRRV